LAPNMTRFAAAIFWLAASCGAIGAPACAADFYAGKIVKIILSTAPGGGYPDYAEILARHMPRHLPGKPTIIVQNMPGAGGVIAANYIYNKAERDGTVFGLVHRAAVSTLPLFDPKGVFYDTAKFGWIGSMNSEVSLCAVWHTVPVASFADLKTRGMIVGGVGLGSDTDMLPYIMNHLFGTRFKVVSGYGRATDINLAMERGEVEGRCGWSVSTMRAESQSWLDEGKLRLLLQVSLTKHPSLPAVPLLMDYVTTERQRQILELQLAPSLMGRPFMTPPGVPADRLALLRQAFLDTIADPALQADAATMKLEINPVPGAAIEQLIAKLNALPKEVIAAAKDAMQKTEDIDVRR